MHGLADVHTGALGDGRAGASGSVRKGGMRRRRAAAILTIK
jgi:hypothetical protein